MSTIKVEHRVDVYTKCVYYSSTGKVLEAYIPNYKPTSRKGGLNSDSNMKENAADDVGALSNNNRLIRVALVIHNRLYAFCLN